MCKFFKLIFIFGLLDRLPLNSIPRLDAYVVVARELKLTERDVYM